MAHKVCENCGDGLTWDDRLENEYVIVFPNGLEADERLRYCSAECVTEDRP